MAIKIDIQTTGVNTLERAAAAFKKVAVNGEVADSAFKKLSKTEQELVRYFEALHKVSGETKKDFHELAESTIDVARQLTSIKEIGSGAFTSLRSSLKETLQIARVARKEFQATAALTSEKLASPAYMGGVTETKASLELQRQVNAEIEKTAKLRAEIAKLNPGWETNEALKAEVANLEKAQARTSAYKAERDRLIATNEALAASEQRVAAARAALSTGAKVSTARTALASGVNVAEVNKGVKAIKSQEAALDKLYDRLKKIKGTEALSSKDFNQLRQTITLTRQHLDATGTSQRQVIAGLSQMVSGYEKTAAAASKSGKTSVDWSKKMQYALGGAARPLGAFTYSYAQLGPLLAGVAFGAAIKQVYELGAAFEYTTTFVDALNDSVDGLSLEQLQTGLLNIEGLRKGPQEMALGMKEFAKAGIDAAESLEQVEELTKFATLAETDLASAVKLVIGQSRAFDVNFVTAANQIAAAALSSATDIQELATALSYTTELAAVSGSTLDEVATALALMANKGIVGSKAATALRTSIIKMQAPSGKLQDILKELGVEFSAFTSEGQRKNMVQMFTDLKGLVDELAPADKVRVYKELFGLRAMKGGVNIVQAMGEEFSSLNMKIKESGEGVTFISEKYEEVADTVQARWEKLGVELEKSLLQAFDSGSVKGILDDWIGVISSDAVRSNISSTVEVINNVASAISDLAGVITSLPVNIVEGGLIYYALFGSNPVGQVIAAMTLADKVVRSTQKSAALAVGESTSNQLDKLISKLESGKITLEQFEDAANRFSRMELVAKFPGLTFDIARLEGLEVADREEILKKAGIEAIPKGVNKILKDASRSTAADMEEFGSDVARYYREEIARLEKEIAATDKTLANFKFLEAMTEQLDKAEAELRSIILKDIRANLEVSDPETFKVLGTIQDQIDKISTDRAISEMGKFDQEMAKVDEKVKKFAEDNELDISTEIVKAKLRDLKVAMEEDIELRALTKINEKIQDLNFKTYLTELSQSEDVTVRLEGALMGVRKAAMDAAEAAGEVRIGEFGGIELTEKGQELFDSMLDNARIFEKEAAKVGAKGFVEMREEMAKIAASDMNLDTKQQALEAFQKQLDKMSKKSLKELRKELIELAKQTELEEAAYSAVTVTEKVAAEIAKAGESAFKQLEEAGRAWRDEFGDIVFKDEEARAQFEQLEEAATDFKAVAEQVFSTKGGVELQKQLKIIEKQFGKNSEAAKDFATVLKKSMREGAKEVKKASKELDFKNFLQGMEIESLMDPAKEAVNDVKIGFAELLDEAYKYLDAQGQVVESGGEIKFTQEGVEYFEKLVNSSGLFEKAIISLQDELRDMNQEIFQTKFDFSNDLRSVAFERLPTEVDMDVKLDLDIGKLNKYSLKEAQDDLNKNLWDLSAPEKELRRIVKALDLGDASKFTDAVKEAGLEGVKGRKQQLELIKLEYMVQQQINREALMAERKEYSAQLSNIQQLTKAAEEAGEAGAKGREYQLKLLEQAKAAAMELETSSTATEYAAKAKLERAKAEMLKYSQAANSLRQESKAAYAQALLEYDRIQSGTGDPGKVNQKSKILKEIQKQILEIMTDQRDETEDQIKEVEKQRTAFEDLIEKMKDGYGLVQEGAEAYGKIIDINTGQTVTWAGKSTSAINDVITKYTELKNLIESINPPNLGGAGEGFGGGKATGGPVQSGTTYLVGEKGPELFSPGTNGHIIPNHQLTSGTKRDTVDINLSFNGSDPVTVQGDGMTVEKLQRALANKQRYGS